MQLQETTKAYLGKLPAQMAELCRCSHFVSSGTHPSSDIVQMPKVAAASRVNLAWMQIRLK
jgi:hypothetical protein